MNDEIKEILDHIKNYPEKLYCLNENEKHLLLDYITNLQQLYENALKINQNENKYRTELETNYIVLQQENERLKEENNNKAMNDYAHAIDESWYRELYDDYKSRCEKAIEYIKENNCPDPYCLTNDILNILQKGGDNNENI